MEDQYKTKEQLINELTELRYRMTELEKSEAERKRVEETLEESEAKFKSLFEGSHDPILLADPETGRFVACNRKAEELSGYSRDEILSMKIGQFTPEDLKGETPEEFQNLVAGKGMRKEWEIITKDGNRMPVEISSTLISVGDKRYLQGVVRDITERKQAEEMLQKSERILRGFMNAIKESAFVVDTEGIVIIANETLAQRLGTNVNELVGVCIYNYLPPEIARERKREVDKVIRTGKPSRYEDRRAGMWIDSFVYPIFDEEGRVVNVGVIAVDITERKRTEEALQFTRFSLDNAAETMICVGRDGRFIDVNNAFCRSSGYSREELLSMTVHDIDPDYSAEVWPEFWEKLKQAGSLTFESCHRTKEGKISPVEITANYFEYNGKEYHCGFARDITERKKVEEALRESEEKYRNLVESVSDVIYTLDSSGVLTYISPVVKNTLGYEPDELIGRQFLEFVHKEDYDLLVRRFSELHEGIVRHIDYRVIGKHGDIKWVRTLTNPIVEERGFVGARGVLIDITERKQAEDQIRSSQEQLRSLSARLQAIREEERTQIAREIHDELGQALTALKMDLFWLSKKLPKDQKPLHEKARSMSQLLDATVKTVKRISTQLRPGLLDDLGLAAAIEWQAEEFQNRTGIKCRVNVKPEEIVLDEKLSTALFRIFQETLTNVARHSHATRVKVSLRQKATKLELRVEDNGKGITEKQISSPKSFGFIGMRERVYPWGGEVKIEGKAGNGTTVTVTIPIKKE